MAPKTLSLTPILMGSYSSDGSKMILGKDVEILDAGYAGEYYKNLFFRILVKFNQNEILSAVGNGTIISAQFTINSSYLNGDNKNKGLYKVTASWDQNTTSLNEPAFNSNPIEVKNFTTGPNRKYTFNVTEVVREWVLGNSSADKGFLLKDETLSTQTSLAKISSPIASFVDFRPVLAITYEPNTKPTLTLNSPTDNVTLYETDTLNIEGHATDADNGNIVNARYQLNGGTIRALATGISTGSNTIPFNKQLTFRGGKLYDGDTAVTEELAEGVAHQLKVWSEDDQGGKSPEQLRHFYVVPNRPPALTIDPFATKSDLINADKVTISGTASDPDGNTVVVTYKLNKGMSTEVYRGKDGAWSFDLSLKDLVAGENTVAIEVVDSYNSKTSKTLKLNKNRVATPLLTSEVRYKIDPPSGTAKGVLLWVQRDVGLTVTADISMGLKNEQETYEAMTLTNTAPVSAGVVEDEFVFESTAEKDNIMLKLTLSRESADVNDAITLISGVLS